MSDDDCDIFNIPTKRPNAMPQKMRMPMEQQTSAEQTDYDFIEIQPEIRKPIAKVNRTATQAKPKARAGKQKKGAATKDAEANNNQLEQAEKKETQALPVRELSPVSQMIFEMEQNRAKTKPNTVKEALPVAKMDDNMPVARRTRSSLGGRSTATELPQTKQTPSPAKQAKATARKRATAQKATAQKATAQKTTARNKKASKTTTEIVQEIDAALMLTAPRGNRQQVAEFAARSHVLDSIDLVSAVMPRVEGFVNLDSDEESSMSMEVEKCATQTNSFDEDNPEISVNLSWLGEIQMYKLRQHQKFSHMFKEISERNKVPIEDIVVNMNDQFIMPTDSPDKVGLKIYHILNGCAMKSAKSRVQSREETNPLLKPRKFQLKIQGDKWKKPLIIPMKKSETFKILYIKCAEEMECDIQDFKLFFDGELLEPEDTPRNQEMEGNEMIDFRMK